MHSAAKKDRINKITQGRSKQEKTRMKGSKGEEDRRGNVNFRVGKKKFIESCSTLTLEREVPKQNLPIT